MDRRTFLQSMAALIGAGSFLSALEAAAPEKVTNSAPGPDLDHFLVRVVTFSPLPGAVWVYADQKPLYIGPHGLKNSVIDSDLIFGAMMSIQKVPAGAPLQIEGPPGSVALVTLASGDTDTGPLKSFDDFIRRATIHYSVRCLAVV